MIPESYYAIAPEAFKSNIKMKSLHISSGVKKVGERAFQNCTKLSKVQLGDTVTHLDKGCFSLCPHLADISIPACLLILPQGVFQEDRRLRDVKISKGSCLHKISLNAFNQCASLEEIDLPKRIVIIEDRALEQAIPSGIFAPGQGEWVYSF